MTSFSRTREFTSTKLVSVPCERAPSRGRERRNQSGNCAGRRAAAGQHTPGGTGLIIEWDCSSLTQNSSLSHAARCFEELLGLGPQQAPAEKLDRLAAHLGQRAAAS